MARRAMARWIAVSALLLLVLSYFIAHRPPFAFISYNYGEEIDYPVKSPGIDEGIQAPDPTSKTVTYGFRQDFGSIEDAMIEELRPEGWGPMISVSKHPILHTWFTKDDWVADLRPVDPNNKNIVVPKGIQCFVMVTKPPSWLARQWLSLRKRLGG